MHPTTGIAALDGVGWTLAATLAAILLTTTESGPFLTENVRMHAFFGYALLFMGFILALRSVVLVFQRDRDDEHDTQEARR